MPHPGQPRPPPHPAAGMPEGAQPPGARQAAGRAAAGGDGEALPALQAGPPRRPVLQVQDEPGRPVLLLQEVGDARALTRWGEVSGAVCRPRPFYRRLWGWGRRATGLVAAGGFVGDEVVVGSSSILVCAVFVGPAQGMPGGDASTQHPAVPGLQRASVSTCLPASLHALTSPFAAVFRSQLRDSAEQRLQEAAPCGDQGAEACSAAGRAGCSGRRRGCRRCCGGRHCAAPAPPCCACCSGRRACGGGSRQQQGG